MRVSEVLANWLAQNGPRCDMFPGNFQSCIGRDRYVFRRRMKHLAQRIVLGLAFIAQAAFGGAPARAQLFVPPPEKILPALDLGSAAPVAAATPAPVKSATITSTAATLDPKKRDPLPPILEAPSVIATRGPATVRTRIGFLKEVVVPGAEVVALHLDNMAGGVDLTRAEVAAISNCTPFASSTAGSSFAQGSSPVPNSGTGISTVLPS